MAALIPDTSNPSATASSIPLGRPSRSGTPPRSRIPTAADAYQITARLVEAQQERVRRAAIIKSMFDGEPPYPPYRLRDAAQSWRSNFNTLEGESSLSNGMTPFYDLIGSVQPVAAISLDSDDASVEDWNRKVSEEFHRFFFNYPSLEQHYWQMLYGFVGFNRGFLWWPVPGDPYFRNLPWQRVMFPDGSNSDPDEWEMFAIRQQFTVSRLWSISSGGDAPGWTKKAVLEAISHAVPHEPTSQLSESIELTQMLRDCDLSISTRSETVKAVSIFVKEFSGKWSWLMVEEDAVAKFEDAPDGKKPQPNFLFRRQSIYGSPTDIIAPFIYEVMDGSINSLGGLGRKIISLMQVKNRLVNSVVDGALMRAYPLLQAKDASALQKSGVLQLGPMHVLAPGYEFLQTNLLADIEGPLATNEFLDRMAESNTAIFKARLEKPRGNPETATAASLRFQNATVLTNSSVNRFYQQFDRFLQRMWHLTTNPEGSRPGAKAARKFLDRCVSYGVPRGTLEKPPLEVRATRSIGNGSPFARQQAISNLASFAPSFGPRGFLAFQQDAISAFAGGAKVERYLPQADILDIPSFQDWMADQENGSMKDGMEPPITDGQDDRRHLKKHVGAMAQALQAASQGGDVMGALAFVQVGLAHSAKHAARLPKDEQGQWQDAFNQINRVAGQLMDAVQRQQEEQQKLQEKAAQLSFDQRLQAAKVAADIGLKQQKNQAQMTQRQERHQQDKALSDASTAADIQRQGAETAASIQLQQAETASKIAAEQKKADAAAEATVIAAKKKPAGGGNK